MSIARQFIFPKVCCRCTKNRAEHSWLIISQDSGSTIRPDKLKGYMVEVPICSVCKGDLEKAQKVRETSFWIISGSTTLLGVLSSILFNQNNEGWWIDGLLGLGIGLIITIFVAWPLINRRTNSEICGVVRGGQTLVFSNLEYQKLFDELNRKTFLEAKRLTE